MELYPIHAMGIHAYCSDIIVDPYRHEEVYFLSICGYQAAVKGIIANLLEYYGISMEIDGEEYYLTRLGVGYKMQIKKMPSGLAHGILFPILAMPFNAEKGQDEFCIFTRNKNELLGLFYRHLDKETEIPLHLSWAEWLWQLFVKQEWLIELKTLIGSYTGYSVRFNAKELHDLISEAIKNRVHEITRCMEHGGGDSDGKFNLS